MLTFLRRLGKLWACLPLGIFFIVMGIILLATSPKSYDKTTGVITDVRSYYDSDEGTKYEYDFTYTVDGKEYQGTFSGSKDDKAGDVITVFYDPANPGSASNTEHTGVIAIVLIVVGVVVLGVGVVTGLRAFAMRQ